MKQNKAVGTFWDNLYVDICYYTYISIHIALYQMHMRWLTIDSADPF